MDPAHRQSAYRVRFDWALRGAEAVASDADVTVVVDVLSFTTTLSVALDAGAVVLPYRWRDETARGYAAEQGAVLAVGRSEAGQGEFSLSPLSLRVAKVPGRLVLPSPNGSSIVSHLASRTKTCSAACLRDASAVAGWIAAASSATTTVAVIAAGERWGDGSLRPAVEDLWGAGAVIAGLVAAGWGGVSPEANAARCGYESVRGGELEALRNCASGRELVDAGYGADVEIAAEVATSGTVPLLVDGHCFVPAGAPDGERRTDAR
jgi:2-phosphosulfolactate phosphatase